MHAHTCSSFDVSRSIRHAEEKAFRAREAVTRAWPLMILQRVTWHKLPLHACSLHTHTHTYRQTHTSLPTIQFRTKLLNFPSRKQQTICMPTHTHRHANKQLWFLCHNPSVGRRKSTDIQRAHHFQRRRHTSTHRQSLWNRVVPVGVGEFNCHSWCDLPCSNHSG